MSERHVVALQDRTVHRPDRSCPCSPKPMRDLLDGAVVWRHRGPDQGKPKPETPA